MYISMLSLFVIEFLHLGLVDSFALSLDSSSGIAPGIPNVSQDTVEGSVGGSNVQDQSESSNDLRDSRGPTRYLQALTTSNLDELSNLDKAPDSSSSTGSMFNLASSRDSTGSIENSQLSATSKSNELALLGNSPQTGSLPNSMPSSDESQAAFDVQNAVHPLSLSNNPKGASDSPGGEIPVGSAMVIGDKDLPSSDDNSNQKQLDFVIPKEVIEAAPEGARNPKTSTPKTPGVAAPDGDTVVDPLDWTHIPKNPVIDDEESKFTEEDITNEKEDRDDQPPDCTRMTKNNFRTAMCCQEGAPTLQGKPGELHPLKTTRRGKCNLYNKDDKSCWSIVNVFCCFCRDQRKTAYDCYHPWYLDHQFQPTKIAPPKPEKFPRYRGMVQQQLKECGSKNKPPLPGRELYTGPRGELQDHGRGYNTYRGKKTYRAACAFEYLILMGVKPKREQWLNQEMPF